MLSSPVRRASLLMPKEGNSNAMRAKVSSGAQTRSEYLSAMPELSEIGRISFARSVLITIVMRRRVEA
ncbi:hypothetical protein D3C72_2476550 [compost metagenome]